MAGLVLVLALHAIALYGLWSYRLIPTPDEVVTLFVETLTEPPKPAEPKPERIEKPKPIEKPRPVEQPQQIVSQAPVVSPAEPVTPPPKPAPVAEAPPAPPPKPAGPVNLGAELSVVCPERTPPKYPSISRRRGEEGVVTLRVELDEQGQVTRAAVATGSGFPHLDEAALSAVKTWRCAPPRRDGQPVRAIAMQPFKFALE